MAWQLWRGSRQFGQAGTFDARFRSRMPRILVAALLLGVVLYALQVMLLPLLGTPGWRYAALAVLLILGGFAYYLIGKAIGAFSAADLKASLRR